MTAVDMTSADSTYSAAPAYLALTSGPDDIIGMVNSMSSLVLTKRWGLQLRDAYYRGEQQVADLGISIPPKMKQLKVALGWPRVAVDAIDERLNVEGFRMGDSAEADTDLQSIWQANGMDCEQQLAHVDALVMASSYLAVGTNDSPLSDSPLISVESPLDFAVQWDARQRSMQAALRLLGPDNDRQATLYLPDRTVRLARTNAQWQVIDVDDHELGVVPVVRMANRPRSYDRGGASEITPEIMSITDAATRTLQGLEVAREFYAAPQRYILGADESAFQNPDGTPRTAWETYLGRVLAIENDESGNAPTVGQFTAYNPSTYTEIIDMYARIMSSITGLPPHVLGYTTDNPASADAIRSTEMRLKMKADRKTRMFGQAWADVMRLALLMRDGELSPAAQSITPVWADTATPTPAATTDSIVKQIQSGYLPATSDVTGEKLGYSVVERQRIEADRLHDQGESFLDELAHSMEAKDFRTANSLVQMKDQLDTPAPVAGS